MKRRLFLSLVMGDLLDVWRQQMSCHKNKLRQSLQGQGITNCSVFRCDHVLFTYTEAKDDTSQLEWPEAIQICLQLWPGIHKSGFAIELIDIFHDNRPVPGEPWRTAKPEQRMAAMARLKSESVASYIYYHYQMQEERPGSFNKTYLIGSFGKYLFSYCELPAVKGVAAQGRLSTKLTPENWHEVMQPHFDPWEDAEDAILWKPMELEFCYSSFD